MKILLVITLFLLTGCTPKIEYVPASCATVSIPTKPRLAIQDIKASDSPNTIHKATWLTIIQLNNDDDKLRRLLMPYSK